ncbi:hypothetical protein V6N12_058352 [Hibiscus sabdariffa]|uniref:Uncharacterized protein n=1 Tax=Hibiscus sabdariffa TaxID=183260 RepID=A0ABR2ESC9_9ROSI
MSVRWSYVGTNSARSMRKCGRPRLPSKAPPFSFPMSCASCQIRADRRFRALKDRQLRLPLQHPRVDIWTFSRQHVNSCRQLSAWKMSGWRVVGQP